MRRALLSLFSTFAFLFAAAAPDENGAKATVQQLFDAMAAHNANAARLIFTPGAILTAVRPNGSVSNSTSEEFAAHVGAAKESWLERMWNPKVLIQGGLAVVWADYDFHLNGTFSHCGVDSVTLVNISGAWKISGIAYTMETSGCAPTPLGPPKK
ncbi:MAG: DUF4440 domain-containing protein [Bryobacteraceae bacterium]